MLMLELLPKKQKDSVKTDGPRAKDKSELNIFATMKSGHNKCMKSGQKSGHNKNSLERKSLTLSHVTTP